MSFYNVEESFFLDATMSTCRPIVQIVPLTDNDVFEYLDAHPETLDKYFAERHGLESFIKTISQSFLGAEAADAETAKNLSRDELLVVGQPGGIDQQASVADNESDDYTFHWDELDSLPLDVGSSPTLLTSPRPPPPATFSLHSSPSPSLHLSRSSVSISPTAASSSPPALSPSSPLSPLQSPSPAPHDSPTPTSASPSSTCQKPRKETTKCSSWKDFEKQSCIKHMLAIRDEGQIKGENRFREAQRRMRVIDGIVKEGNTAVKNFWNREGRALSGFDERKNKKAPLATSQQGKKAQISSSSISSSSPQQPSKTKRHKPFPTASCTPATTKKSHKRDRDDGEDEWQPDESTINAVAKGLRTPKKARTAYAP